MDDIKKIIKIAYGMQGVMVHDNGDMIDMYSRQKVGLINFQKSSYNNETKSLSVCMTPRQPLESIMVEFTI